MLVGWLTLFIVVTLVAILISAYLMEENPQLSIPFIFIGMIFSVLSTYGFWNVEWPVLQADDTFIMETANYGEPYSYVFMFLFFVFLLFLIRAGMNMWKEALATKGEISYSMNKKYFR